MRAVMAVHAVLFLCVSPSRAKYPAQFAREHWLREDTGVVVPELGYRPTPDGIPPEFDCAWREYGTTRTCASHTDMQ